MDKLTDGQICMLKYFWEEKGSLERYFEFDNLKPILREQYPQIIKAWEDYKASIAIMDAVIKSL